MKFIKSLVVSFLLIGIAILDAIIIIEAMSPFDWKNLGFIFLIHGVIGCIFVGKYEDFIKSRESED